VAGGKSKGSDQRDLAWLVYHRVNEKGEKKRGRRFNDLELQSRSKLRGRGEKRGTVLGDRIRPSPQEGGRGGPDHVFYLGKGNARREKLFLLTVCCKDGGKKEKKRKRYQLHTCAYEKKDGRPFLQLCEEE